MIRELKPAALGLVIALTGGTLGAQGVQTGTLRGTVLGADGAPAAGVEVRVSSGAMQGIRTATTGADGTYALADLPPGEYDVEIQAAGAGSARERVIVPLGGIARANVRLQLNSIVVEVIAPEIVVPGVDVNLTFDEVDALPMLRTPTSVFRFVPGASDAVPNAPPTEGQGQVTISGGFAHDNLLMINGVDIGDNIFGHPQNLFIEDAIEETHVLIAGIPAEYGRFGGGVGNVITKSGGNVFSGSYRLNLSNRAWGTETPFETTPRVSRTNLVHEGTFGGPIRRDRVWLFTAGRIALVETTETLQFTAVPYTTTDDNWRGELKVTATPADGHTVHGTVIGNPRTQTNQANFNSPARATVDPFALSDKERPNHLFVFTYRGALNTRWLADAQYSQQQFQTDAGGGASTSIVDSPFFTSDFVQQYNAPHFDKSDPDRRNNRQLTGSLSYVWRGHEIKAGYEFFRSEKIGGNSQSPTGYRFETDYLTDAAGDPVLDGNGRFVPVFIPGDSWVTRFEATPGARMNINHNSAYVQDRWNVSPRASLDLGARLEHVTSEATGAAEGIETTRVVPRLGVSYDATGDGRYVVRGTYSRYSGRYADALFVRNSSVGNPNEVYGVYIGEPGQGRDFLQGFDPGRYEFVDALYPTANVRFDPDLSSPVTDEFSLSLGTDLRRRGSLQATYVWRRTDDIIEDFVNLTNGTTRVTIDDADFTLTNRVYAGTNAATRDYEALLIQGAYRPAAGWTIDGHWTLQLDNEGNYEGEASGQILTSQNGDYPEIFSEARHYPSGRLPSFQRHKIHVWSIYTLDFGRAGAGSLSGLWRYNSARTYTLRSNYSLTPTQVTILADAGYPDRPAFQQLYFSPLGSESFTGYGVVDLAGSYHLPIGGRLRPRFDVEVFNVFNNQTLIAWNTSILPNAGENDPVDALGLPTTYRPAQAFGQGRSELHYPVPFAGQTGGRTLRVSLGLRF